MGNAARKARKAAGIKFQHPVKELTALPLRDGQTRKQKIKHMEAALEGVTDRLPSWAQLTGEQQAEYTTTLAPASTKKSTKKSTGKSTLTVVDEALPLDPKPYRVGRKRYATGAEAYTAHRGDEGEKTGTFDIILAPRNGYDQDTVKYPPAK